VTRLQTFYAWPEVVSVTVGSTTLLRDPCYVVPELPDRRLVPGADRERQRASVPLRCAGVPPAGIGRRSSTIPGVFSSCRSTFHGTRAGPRGIEVSGRCEGRETGATAGLPGGRSAVFSIATHSLLAFELTK
jgi:hypothetical protein